MWQCDSVTDTMVSWDAHASKKLLPTKDGFTQEAKKK